MKAKKDTSSISEYVTSLKRSPILGHQVVFHTVLPPTTPRYEDVTSPWPADVARVLKEAGIGRLYSHQARAMDLVRSGRHVVVATPTASGKSIVYNLPVLERLLADPAAKALYIYPLKALAQDQHRSLNQLFSCLPVESAPDTGLYDGDTPPGTRARLRRMPPSILLTNPEMLHLSLLPYHSSWKALYEGLGFVVVDEVHTYRGVLGSHMAWVFRRLKRVCSRYGSRPVFIFCSATVGNPGALASELTGLEVVEVTESGAPTGERHVVFLNPDTSPAHAATLLLKAAMARGLRTIVYTQSRKLTELIGIWAASEDGPHAGRLATYRAGYLPPERRKIESRLASGELLGVVSTSALELGIDIGNLDLCILVGYPGTVMATWQRGGRVGRNQQDSALVLVAQEDALDQYFMRNPRDLLERPPEAAVLNPYNPIIMARHLECAAAEGPICKNEPDFMPREVQAVMDELTGELKLLEDHGNGCYHAARRYPHRGLDLRGAGRQFQILTEDGETTIGHVDELRAYKETHPGAVYIHLGETYVITRLDTATRQVFARRKKADYFTRVLAEKRTEILDVCGEKVAWGTRFFLGRLRVTDQVTGYERRRIRGQMRLGTVPLDLPPQVFETEGMWFEIPNRVQEAIQKEKLHFMGGIHALEHLCIGVMPLLVLTDRWDLGGISTTFHPQVPGPAVFIYDGIPGGIGLCRQAFHTPGELLERAFKAVKGCPCERGCPSCVHSPKCGSGNRPIDKAAAVKILEGLKEGTVSHAATTSNTPTPPRPARTGRKERRARSALSGFGVFDLETQLSAQEVGGWHRADLMRVSCAVVYDSRKDNFVEFFEGDMQELVRYLAGFDLVVGFNVKRFDYKVLSGYSDFDFWKLPTLDILEEIHRSLGYRLSLDHLARVTLGASKTADGLQALRWWKQGRVKEIVAYCRQDVSITRDLFLFGREQGYLLFKNKAGDTVKVPVSW